MVIYIQFVIPLFTQHIPSTHTHPQFTVLTDRSQGGNSIIDGEVELMVIYIQSVIPLFTQHIPSTHTHPQFIVLTDRSQGGNSNIDGEVELMVIFTFIH